MRSSGANDSGAICGGYLGQIANHVARAALGLEDIDVVRVAIEEYQRKQGETDDNTRRDDSNGSKPGRHGSDGGATHSKKREAPASGWSWNG